MDINVSENTHNLCFTTLYITLHSFSIPGLTDFISSLIKTLEQNLTRIIDDKIILERYISHKKITNIL